MSPHPPIGVGVIGLGGMGHVHARNVSELGGTVVAGADVAEDARERFAAEFDAATYPDAAAMYADADLDAVVITTPNKFHEAAAVGALDAGLDVLVEKPLANTLASAERIAAAARDSEGFCMVGYHNRFCPAAEMFADYRNEGAFGDLTHVEANYVRRRGIPGAGSWFTNESLSGGGALIDIGVHALDYALHLLGFPEVVEVSGVARSEFGPRDEYVDPDGFAGGWESDTDTFDVDDAASAFIRTETGTTISLEVSWAANRDATNSFVVHGTEAGARLELGGDTLQTYGTGLQGTDHYVDAEFRGNADAVESGHRAQDHAFVEAVAAGDAPDTNTVDQALAVQRVVDAIYRSSDQGGAVPLGSDAVATFGD